MRSPIILCFSLLLLALPIHAEESAAVPPTAVPAAAPLAPLGTEERASLLEKAQQLRKVSEELKKVAESESAAAQKTCWEKFLVSRCLDQAKVKKREVLLTSKKMEQEARHIEQEVKKREAADRAAKNVVELPLREAKALERAEKNRLEREEMQAKVAEKMGKAK